MKAKSTNDPNAKLEFLEQIQAYESFISKYPTYSEYMAYRRTNKDDKTIPEFDLSNEEIELLMKLKR